MVYQNTVMQIKKTKMKEKTLHKDFHTEVFSFNYQQINDSLK